MSKNSPSSNLLNLFLKENCPLTSFQHPRDVSETSADVMRWKKNVETTILSFFACSARTLIISQLYKNMEKKNRMK